MPLIPDGIETAKIGIEQVPRRDPPQVNRRRMRRYIAVDVRIDQHLIIKAVDRAIEDRSVGPELDPAPLCDG